MILGYKQQFKQPILDGTKIHTIRTDKPRRWKRGKKIHHATGNQTPNYDCFKEDVCISCQDVYMSYAFNDIIEITVGDTYLFGYAEREAFAKNDGFKNWEEFFEYFYPIIKATEDNFYIARLIHWTDKRY